MFKANRFLALIVLFLFVVIMGSCGGGGGGGGGTNPPSDTTTVSGTVSPPVGISPSTLTIVSLGDTSPVGTTGSFSTEVYKEGVTIVAAMPEGKEFGLMNVVATSTTSTSSAKITKVETKIVSAYKAASSSSIELNAKTTAVSMVFITPYFLTNDPVKAANIISIIENDHKVASLASVIESVFNESDPLSNLTLQQALIDAVQSVLDTVSAQASMATKAAVPSPPKILLLPKSSFAKSLKALFVTNPPYYADQDYVTVKAIETTSGYDVSVESKNGGSVDWIAGAMQLDSSQFSSLLDLQVKASNNRSLYENEQSHVLGELDATAKSYFRYFDLIGTAFDWAFSEVFGNALEDRVTVPSTQDGIYLVRAYSGGWSKLVDSGEKPFVRTQVPNGSNMDTKSLSINGFMVIFDTMSAFVAFDKLFPDEMNKVAKAGLEEAFSKVPYVMANPDPNMRDLISVTADITKATLSKLTEILTEQLSKNFFKTIYRTTEIIGKSVVNLATLNTVIELGKPADRLLQLLVSATPMETAIIVVGEPFPTPVDTEKPSTPTNLQATATSSTQIDLSWDPSTDNVGVAGYKIYRNGAHLKSVTTASTSDTGLNPSTQYCYTVSAYDTVGNESEQSNQVCATTLSTPDTIPPSVPTGLTATAVSSNQINLSWSASTDNVGVAGYKIYRDGTYLKTATTTSTSDTGLSPSTNYCYTVSAYDAAGNESGQSGQACAATQGVWEFKLPDTGQTGDYTTTFGEDSDYTINPMSFTDNGNGTITDNVTGLMWQKCSAGQNNDATCSGTVSTYNWYEASGTADTTYNPSSTDVCGSLSLGGYTDWRLPNEMELMTIVNFGTYNPAIDATYFPITNASHGRWSSATYAGNTSNAWYVSFYFGSASYFNKADSLYVQCVRGGQYPSQSFTDNSNGTITDNVTGLMWQKEDDNTTRTWEQALTYCEGLTLAGYSDWRLPNVKELRSIVDSTTYDPAINTTYFPGTEFYGLSSTTDAFSTSYVRLVSFYGGRVDSNGGKTGDGYVRCVRGGSGSGSGFWEEL